MQLSKCNIIGNLVGVAPAMDFQTKSVIGVQLDLGRRTDAGKFVIDTIKVLGAKQADFTNFLDEVVEIQLENVTISSYSRANQALISLKAQKATIL
ncbi:TPA: hypothetical protein U2D13_000287 [Streptococcus suis]|uniref:hypothetical protein n=1 Tax=Streptococcus suis TaxID=1307 RepID=UPI001C939088|nr:hypothetical protein [Streptococcus suis]MBY5009667.1 hypothetical protein [Streptococcus suis]MDG4517841.1 hypothetical protein [Streptococcus suis]HEM6037270.1 hypothetical protein [Streptococcus suis]HEM6054419.1 hypothetical protein [Streptococcus suis]HEM6390679.1 hypothetical protein [Streptococcus suis]